MKYLLVDWVAYFFHWRPSPICVDWDCVQAHYAFTLFNQNVWSHHAASLYIQRGPPLSLILISQDTSLFLQYIYLERQSSPFNVYICREAFLFLQMFSTLFNSCLLVFLVQRAALRPTTHERPCDSQWLRGQRCPVRSLVWGSGIETCFTKLELIYNPPFKLKDKVTRLKYKYTYVHQRASRLVLTDHRFVTPKRRKKQRFSDALESELIKIQIQDEACGTMSQPHGGSSDGEPKKLKFLPEKSARRTREERDRVGRQQEAGDRELERWRENKNTPCRYVYQVWIYF